MKYLSTLSALVTLALAGGSARAETVSFGYSWSVPTGTVIASGTGTVSFALPAGDPPPTSADLGSLTAVVLLGPTLTTNSSATTTPDVFNHPYSVQLTLTEGA